MDKASHLSVVLDLSLKQWHLAAQSTNPHPISLATFLSHFLAFLNAHIACKDENSLAVFGAFPGKRCVSIHFASELTLRYFRSVMLYSSTMSVPEENIGPADANTYRPFRVMDTILMQNIAKETEALGEPDSEGACHISLPSPVC